MSPAETAGDEAGETPPTPFTLPSRPPGKTANLNIGDGIPDWLKTGDKPETKDKKGMERHRPGDDLPTWLLDEGMEPDLFGDSRTTDELFAAAEQDTPKEAEPVEPELPEWLRGLAPEGTGPLPMSTSSRPAEEEQEALDAWFADFEDTALAAGAASWLDDSQEESLPAAESGGSAGEPLPASQPDDSEQDAVSSWLADLVSAEEAAGEPGAPAPGPEPDTGSVPADWLAGLDVEPEPSGEAEDATEPPSTSGSTPRAADDHFREEGIPDWLADLEQSPFADSPDAQPTSGEGPEIPDWLDEGEASEEPEGSVPSVDAGIPDWIAGTGLEVEPGQPELEAPGPEDEIPDWLAGLEAPLVAREDEAELDEFAFESAESAPTVFSEPGEETPDWLADLEALPVDLEAEPQPSEPGPTTVETEAPAPETVESTAEEIPDWLADLEALPVDLERETGRTELHPAGVDAGTREPESIEPVAEETPDWLADLEAYSASLDDEAQPDEFEAGAFAAGSEALPEPAIPDWLSELPSPALEQVTSGEELPDWLQDEAPPELSTGDEPVPEPEPGESFAAEQEDDWLPAGEEAPDWLLAIEPETEPEPESDTGDEVPDWLTELDAAIGELEAASSESGVDWLEDLETPGPAPDRDDAFETGPPSAITQSPDEDAAAEEPERLPAWLAPTELSVRADHLEFEPEEAAEPEATAPPEPAAEPAGEEAESVPSWLEELEEVTGDLALPAAESEVPDWLREGLMLDAVEGALVPGDDEPAAPIPEAEPAEPAAAEREEAALADLLGSLEEDEIVPADELPDWLDDVVTPEPGAPERTPEEMETVPEVLASHHLPEWLEDSFPDDEIAEPTPAEELPSWLQPPTGPAEREPLAGIELGASGEWNDILGELAGTGDEAEELSTAEIPEWLQALKPGDHERERTAARAAAAPPSEGPLAGLAGVLPVEPVIAKPRTAEFATRYEASREQQQQAALLQQLVRTEPHAEERVVTPARSASSPWLRLVLSLLLLTAVIAGLFLPNLLPVTPTPLYPVAPVAEALSSAAGDPVLVIFDYTPAVSGVLDQQAAALLTALAAQDSPVIYGSQSAAGVGLGTVATTQIDALQAESLGYIPAGTLGLRRLAACLATADPTAPACSNYPGAVAQASAIVLITGERDSLVDWIEQVETIVDIPVVAGVTRALVPVAAPYLETGQLDGILAGEPAATALAGTDPPPAQTAQTLATWLVAGLLLVGNLLFLLVGRRAHR
jgi:hypothetical protein